MGQHSAIGSLWHRWDLHFHTPSSFEYGDQRVTNEQIVERLILEQVRVVAVTDHHKIDVNRIMELQKLGQEQITVLPGIELRDEHGGKPIHYICIFPEDSDLDHVWTTLQGSLGLTPASIRDKGGDEKLYVPISQGADITKKLGGLISIHAGAKSNSIEEIDNKEQFQQRIKYDITKSYVHLMEIGQLKDIHRHFNTIFPATGLEKPLIICSDNHKIADYTVKAQLWLKADPTFRGLLMVLREPRDRVYIGDKPPEIVRVERNPTKYIRGVFFQRKPNAPNFEKWFNGSVSCNPGLVAIVGNKGSGKSALADTVGLLGCTKNSDSFSFLSRERFRHPTNGLAAYFDATIEWNSGEKVTKCLADTIKPEEVERVKYLPQDHVEKVCNEIVGIGEQGFEQELKSVIFSHVPETKRLGYTTLDELVRFQTGEKQNRIDSLGKQLRETSRMRAIAEAQADPSVKRELLEKIERRKLELEAHERLKPVKIPDPSSAGGLPSPENQELLEQLSIAETKKVMLNEQIKTADEALSLQERRVAVAKRLLEKLENFQKDFDVFKVALHEDVTELGISVAQLINLSVNYGEVVTVRDKAAAALKTEKDRLDFQDPPGLRKQLTEIDSNILQIQSKLDAPNRAFQIYLKELSDWQETRKVIEGSEKETDSLKGMQSTISVLDQIPAKIEDLRNQQVKLALQILEEKIAQTAIYRTLYSPVQDFIDSHELAKDKLKLEFRAELVNEDFTDRLMSILALNRRGSFMGIDEGRARSEELTQATKWEEPESVQKYLENVDSALHTDLRETPPSPTQLKDQILKGKTPEEVFNLLFGLEYIRPKYVLRWEGKELSMLSPGERGTLLLVFYLLIDKGDIPLIIDQPEGNLDNHTVAKVLVDCIKAARKRRQVFIVTHNPNLAVVCDADQVIHASMDKANHNTIEYVSGALENPAMCLNVTNVLEGTRWAFDVRGAKYEVGNHS